MLPEHKWEIAVLAGSYYTDLTQRFSGNDIALAYENDYMGMQSFAFSYHIDELDDPADVGRRLYSLQLLLNGALRLSSGKATEWPIVFTDFAAVNGGCRHPVYANTIEETPFSSNPEIDESLRDSKLLKNLCSSHLLNLAKSDQDLRGLLFLVGLISINSPLECILTWGTLYKILDSIRFYSKELGLEVDSFAASNQVNAFTAACNNMSILGVYARHGAAGNSPPKKFISDINEAIGLIVRMASAFCQAYVAAKHP